MPGSKWWSGGPFHDAGKWISATGGQLVDTGGQLVDKGSVKSRAGESPTRLERPHNLSRHVTKYQLLLSRISRRKDKLSGHLILVVNSLVDMDLG